MVLAFMKNWKLIGALVISVGLFVSGWLVNGWRLGEQIANQKVEVALAYEAKRTELLAEYTVLQEKDTTARLALSRTLAATRAREAGLLKELDDLKLLPPVVEIKVERVVETVTEVVDGECTATTTVIANPFSAEFVRVWNASADGSSAGNPIAQ